MLIMPLASQAQELGIDYQFNKYYGLDKEELQEKLITCNRLEVMSGILSFGGITAVCFGGYYVYAGGEILLSYLSSDDLIDLWGVLGFSGAMAITVVGSAIFFGGMIAVELGIRSIVNLEGQKDQIRLTLKQFAPTSYKDRPGIGIGFSIAIG
jgi:hypothetical protein